MKKTKNKKTIKENRIKIAFLLPVIFLFSFLFLISESRAADDDWESLGVFPGISDVRATAFDSEGNLYVGGYFDTAGNVPAEGIAKWDGTSWSALGGGINGTIYSIAIDSNDNVYVGGDFSEAGGNLANNIAMWNGTSWSALGSGISGWVYSIVTDSSDNVYVGGAFSTAGGISARSIAMWNGTSWSALGSGTNDTITTLNYYSGILYVGGQFSSIGGVSANNIATWNGTSWSALGGGSDGTIYDLKFSQLGTLFAAGYFSYPGGTSQVAYWDGSSWNVFENDFMDNASKIGFDQDGILYVVGGFTSIDGMDINHIAMWNGTSWSALGGGVNEWAYSIDFDTDGNLYVGGNFSVAGNTQAVGIAMWNGSDWSSFGSGLASGWVQKIDIDSEGNLYAVGNFSYPSNRVGMWSGSSWSALGSGIDIYGSASSLAIDSDDNVYVGGGFTEAGGNLANNIAMWNGTSWSALGGGVNSDVLAIAIDSENNVYAGGWFSEAGGSPAYGVAMWNGSSWTTWGDELNGVVSSFAIDSENNVYAGGIYEIGGNPVGGIAKWDGTSWSALGGGLDGNIRSIAVDFDDNVYVGGDFSEAGGNLANNIAMWNGTSWSALGEGTDGRVRSVAVDFAGRIYVGGGFDYAGEEEVNGFAVWDGNSWNSLGSGVGRNEDFPGELGGPFLTTMAIGSDGDLYVGGQFSRIGGNAFRSIAKYDILYESFELQYSSGANGSVIGDLSQTVSAGSDGTEVTAVANSGYRFLRWSDDSTQNPRRDQNVNSNISVSAIFDIEEGGNDEDENNDEGDNNGNNEGDDEEKESGITSFKEEDGKTKFEVVIDSEEKEKKKIDGKNKIPLDEITIEAKKNIEGEFTIDKKKDLPDSFQIPEKYKNTCQFYTTLKVESDFSNKKIEEVEMEFRVLLSWIEENGIDYIRIFQTKSGETVELDSEIEKRTSKNLIVEAKSGKLTGYWNVLGCKNETPVIFQNSLQEQNEGNQESNLDDGQKIGNLEVGNEEKKDEDENSKNKKGDNFKIATQKESKNTLERLEEIKENVSSIENEISTISAIAAIAPLAPIAASAGSFGNLMLIFKQNIFNLIGILGYRRNKKRDWGVVYDSNNGEPISFARVSVLDDETGNVKEVKITDKYGSYFFLVSPGKYSLKVEKDGYVVQSLKDLENSSTFYQNNYQGNLLEFAEHGKISNDVGMKKENTRSSFFRIFFEKNSVKFLLASVFWTGFIVSVLIAFFFPSVINFIVVFAYVYMIAMRTFTSDDSQWGIVTNSSNVFQPFSNILLKDKNSDSLVARTISDEKGRYFLIANPGEYVISATSVGESPLGGSKEISLSVRDSIKVVINLLRRI